MSFHTKKTFFFFSTKLNLLEITQNILTHRPRLEVDINPDRTKSERILVVRGGVGNKRNFF